MSLYSKEFDWDEIRYLDYTSITNAYLPIGSPLEKNMRAIKFCNTTDGDIFISNDGQKDKDVVPAGGQFIYDITCNRALDTEFSLKSSTQVYVKYFTAPTKGNLFFVAMFGKG